MTTRILLLMGLAGSLWTLPVCSQDDVESEVAPSTLVRQLGAADFRVRRAAEQQLLQLGVASLPAVEQGAKSSNAEIRFRSLRLADQLQITLAKQNLAALESNPWQASPGIYPLWERWQELVGDSPSSRALLSRMVRAEPELLMHLAAGRVAEWRAEFELRSQTFRFPYGYGGEGPNAMSAATLLFVALQAESQIRPEFLATTASAVNSGNFVSLLNDPVLGTAARTLLDRWLNHKGTAAQYRLEAGVRLGSAGALSTASEVLKNPAMARGLAFPAIMYLARFGGPEAIENLEHKLQDVTLIQTKPPETEYGNIQVRDLALLAILHLTKQNPETYGFDRLRPSGQSLYQMESCAFANEQVRQAAFVRWEKWRREYLRSALPEPADASEGTEL